MQRRVAGQHDHFTWLGFYDSKAPVPYRIFFASGNPYAGGRTPAVLRGAGSASAHGVRDHCIEASPTYSLTVIRPVGFGSMKVYPVTRLRCNAYTLKI